MVEPEKFRWPAGEVSPVCPETQVMLQALRDDPTLELYCAHDDGARAVVLCDVPRGCVALPGVQAQPLCHHHWASNGSFEGMDAVVDLSLDGEWSKQFGVTPLFTLMLDATDGSVSVVSFDAD